MLFLFIYNHKSTVKIIHNNLHSVYFLWSNFWNIVRESYRRQYCHTDYLCKKCIPSSNLDSWQIGAHPRKHNYHYKYIACGYKTQNIQILIKYLQAIYIRIFWSWWRCTGIETLCWWLFWLLLFSCLWVQPWLEWTQIQKFANQMEDALNHIITSIWYVVSH